jgi:hypothetical protein
MKTLDWLNNDIIGNGLLCGEYTERVRKSMSKKQLFEVCADANGVTFLAEMRAKGHPLPYEVIREDFEKYINGKHKPVYGNLVGRHYTSAIYCMANFVENNILVDTTLACFLCCVNVVYIKSFNFARIVVDQNSKIKVYCPDNANAVIEVFGDGVVDVVEGADRVRIKKK